MNAFETPVSDTLLDDLCAFAREARAGRTSATGAVLLLRATPELFEELLTYRQLIGAMYARKSTPGAKPCTCGGDRMGAGSAA